MEDMLRLTPVVCLDERPVQSLDPARPPVSMKPGLPARVDYEYIRGELRTSSASSNPLAGRRLTYATKNRIGRAFTQTEKSVIDTLGTALGRRLWRSLKIHYTPKHGSWLNAAEMEGRLVSRESLGTVRIGHSAQTVKSDVRLAPPSRARPPANSRQVHRSRRLSRVPLR